MHAAKVGVVPGYIKSEIEGGELGMVRGSFGLLKEIRMRQLLLALAGSIVLLGCERELSNPLLGTPQWGTYNRDYAGTRFSPEREINVSNVDHLREHCSKILEQGRSFETGPLVLGHFMFLTTGDATFAIDARNCDLIWMAKNSMYEDSVDTNRGVALLNGRLFRGTTDGKFIALDARTGRELWNVTVLDPAKGERFTMAPIAWHDLVFVGDAVGDNGMAGNVYALDVKTGREVWRTSTIDKASWPRGADTGGAGMWTSFSLDPATQELFVSVANPAPDFVKSVRPGRNLYTDSVLVLGALDGRIHWYYQVTPGDEHDWDLAAAPVLYRYRSHPFVAAGSKDGHLYIIDRTTHELRFRVELTKIENADVPLGTRMLHVCPGGSGGVDWNGPALDRLSGLILVESVDWCGRFFQTPNELHGAQGFLGGGEAPDPASTAKGWIIAVDPGTGKVRWKYRASKPVVAGLTPTGGGITFAATTGGEFLAFDTSHGNLLYRRFAAPAAGGVVTYSVDGKEYVAYVTGRTLRGGFVEANDDAVTILSL